MGVPVAFGLLLELLVPAPEAEPELLLEPHAAAPRTTQLASVTPVIHRASAGLSVDDFIGILSG
jgi:hypothetical protein